MHIIFSFIAFFSYILLLADLGLIGYLGYHAYVDADTLDRYVGGFFLWLVASRCGVMTDEEACRCEVPFFGPLASSILDDE